MSREDDEKDTEQEQGEKYCHIILYLLVFAGIRLVFAGIRWYSLVLVLAFVINLIYIHHFLALLIKKMTYLSSLIVYKGLTI
jgi:hypothetical protein